MNKPVKTYTPLMSEVLTKVNNAKTKDKKIAVLKEHDSEPLRMLIKSSFDPKIKWVMPEGQVPYKPNELPEGTEHTLLSQEVRKFYHYIEGADNQTPRMRKETMFIQMLEGLHSQRQKLSVMQRIKSYIKNIKVLSDAVVKSAFGWTDDYWMPNGNII